MATLNKNKPKKQIVDTSHRTAGGMGVYAANQDAEKQLRRIVMANMLWEDCHYDGWEQIEEQIKSLIPLIAPQKVFDIAFEARTQQKLRQIPLFIAREMLRHPDHRVHVGGLLPLIIRRPNEATEFMAIYWKDGKTPIAHQVKVGLRKAAQKWDLYQLGKYKQDDKEISPDDVLMLTHAKPRNTEQGINWANAINKDHYPETTKSSGFKVKSTYDLDGKPHLATPDTWEVELSKSQDKKASWVRLVVEKRLGALALMKNLRNMIDAGVEQEIIEAALFECNPQWLLPIDFIRAADQAPKLKDSIEKLMFKCLAQAKRLTGTTVLVVDVSGSMQAGLASKTLRKNKKRVSYEYSRMDAAAMMAIMARELCDHAVIYATAGSDGFRTHRTEHVSSSLRGFALQDRIRAMKHELGGGGIFTRQCLEYIKEREASPDRILIFSDSQDCDLPDRRRPAPFGKFNYIIDVSAERYGINYAGLWTAEISGWSEAFINMIPEYERIQQ